MTADQIEAIVRKAIAVEAHSYGLLVLVVVVVGSFAAAFFGSYLHSKANHKAIKEDLDILAAQAAATTKATEEIKGRIGTSTWVQQQRWEVKRQLYTDLLFALYKLADLYGYIEDLTIAEDKYGHPTYQEQRVRIAQRLEERESQVPALWEEVLRIRGFGELVLSKDTISLLDRLHARWTGEDDPQESHIDAIEFRLVSLREAHREVVVSAKQDMEL